MDEIAVLLWEASAPWALDLTHSHSLKNSALAILFFSNIVFLFISSFPLTQKQADWSKNLDQHFLLPATWFSLPFFFFLTTQLLKTLVYTYVSGCSSFILFQTHFFPCTTSLKLLLSESLMNSMLLNSVVHSKSSSSLTIQYNWSLLFPLKCFLHLVYRIVFWFSSYLIGYFFCLLRWFHFLFLISKYWGAPKLIRIPSWLRW